MVVEFCFKFCPEREVFSSILTRSDVGPKYLLIQRVPGAHYQAVERPGREAAYPPPPSRANVNILWSSISSPSYPS